MKENDLAHGEFSKWVSEIGIQEREAQRFMKIANELPNATTWSALGTRALYLIATLPEEERTKEHVTEKGETKTPDEMTVRELQELKKQLKAKDEQIAMQAKMIDDLSEQEPEIIEKEVVVEKIPDDYSFFKGNYEVTKSNYEFYKSQNEDLRNEIKNLEERIKQESSSEQETKLLQEKITALESTRFEMHEKEKSYKRVTNLSLEIENILDNHACLKYSKDFKNLSLDRQAFLELEDSIERLEQWISEIKSELPNKNIIEGELLK
ncbi:hypothetical protein CU019_1953 [Enterococcus faecium]|nr:hypothetical protein [Enterococcus faecium]MBK4799152.1 hypothetical protein [Enterococcus faecium]MBK4820550.1 hypothetical protein [Enterococcus faecium]